MAAFSRGRGGSCAASPARPHLVREQRIKVLGGEAEIEGEADSDVEDDGG